MALGSVLAWLALSLGIIALGAPITAALFPRLADRGASVALPLVLIVVFYVSYYIGRVSLWVALVTSVVLVGVGALVGLRRDVEIRWTRVIEIGAIFTLTYVFLVFVRATDPAIIAAGGEKFLDFGLLKTLLRAETIPPPDFWYAGESVLYYYGGHLLVSQATHLLGTPPGVAYNLALSAVFAGYVSTAYGLAGNVAARDDQFERRAAFLGAFFVGWASNLFTPIRLVLRPLPDGLAEQLAKTIDVWAGRYDREGALITDAEPFSMWDATGIIDGTIHEMPLFAFVNGDLHAHMMAPPITLLLASALYVYTRTPPHEARRRLFLLFGVVPAIGGSLAIINTWSFFATTGLTVLTVLFDRDLSDSLPRTFRSWIDSLSVPMALLGRLGTAIVAGVCTGLIAVLLSLPFWLAKVGGRSVAFFPDRSSLPALVVVHGTFLLPVALYFGYLLWAKYGLTRRKLAAVSLATLGGIAVLSIAGFAALGLVFPFLFVGFLLAVPVLSRIRERSPVVDSRVGRLPGFELVLLFGALGLILLVEFIYLQEHAGAGRFNTVFKMYAQVWVLFSVGTAIALGRLLQLAPDIRPIPNWPTVLRGLIVLFVLISSVYGVFAVGFQVDDAVTGDGTLELDGTAWIDRFHPDEAAAIEWLDSREGTPIIVTRPGEAYSWPGAVSVFTGLPTIIGWQHHERGFGRAPVAVAERAGEVDDIYTGSPELQRDLLAKYNATFVYVGPSERETYGDAITVDRLVGLNLANSFEDGEVNIYRVSASVRAD